MGITNEEDFGQVPTFLNVALVSISNVLGEISKSENLDEIAIEIYATPSGFGLRASFIDNGKKYIVTPNDAEVGVVRLFAILGQAVFNRSTNAEEASGELGTDQPSLLQEDQTPDLAA